MGMSMHRHLLAVGLLAAALGLSACMTVLIQAPDGAVRVEHGLGFLRIELPSTQTAISGAVSGVGMAVTPLGWHVGYARQRWAVMGPQCQAVLWLDSATLDAGTRRWLSALDQVCALDTAVAACPSDGTCRPGVKP